MTTPLIEINTPVQCVSCGKTAEKASLMHRVMPKNYTPEDFEKISSKYYGLYICNAFGNCYEKIKKPAS